MNDVTRILSAIEAGDPSASSELLPLVYAELRKLAAHKLAHEKPGQTLQATALVHEAYIRLLGREDKLWDSRGHFFSAAAEAMRRILVDRARQKASRRHGGNLNQVELQDIDLASSENAEELLALDEALNRLEELDPVKAKLVKLRYFSGFTTEQAADVLGIGVSTAHKYWSYAKCWLRAEVHGIPE